VRRVLLLDSGPLGLITQPKISSEVVAVNRWLLARLRAGDQVRVPAIVHYEIRRELLRAEKSVGLVRLDSFVESDADRYMPLTDQALRLAAELWAQTRRGGRPTAEASALDVDVILAAQALTLKANSEILVVTTNPRHLRPFVDARLWGQIED
jgi:predicted nucleic acid-binding protein